MDWTRSGSVHVGWSFDSIRLCLGRGGGSVEATKDSSWERPLIIGHLAYDRSLFDVITKALGIAEEVSTYAQASIVDARRL